MASCLRAALRVTAVRRVGERRAARARAMRAEAAVAPGRREEWLLQQYLHLDGLRYLL